MEPTVNFAFIEMGNGRLLLGKVTDLDFETWKSRGGKLVISDPRTVMMAPAQAGEGVQMAIVPTFPVETRQENFVLDPVCVELIGQIVSQGDQGETLAGNTAQSSNLYSRYLEAVQSWKANLSGIIAPSGVNLSLLDGGKK